MDTLIIIVTIIDVIVALLLIGVILVQQSKDGGGMAGSAFGGAGEAVFGGQAADQLTKITRVLTAMFFILTLALAVIIGRRTDKDVSVVDTTAAAIKAPAANNADADKGKKAIEKKSTKVEKVKKETTKTSIEKSAKKKDTAVKTVKKETGKTEAKLKEEKKK